jgi:hypothetical protein
LSPAGSTRKITTPDPFGDIFHLRQPDAGFDAYIDAVIGDMASALVSA